MAELIRAARVGCLVILLASMPCSTAAQEPPANPQEATASPQEVPADLIVTGRIYTADRTDPVEAFAVRGDRFVKVGTTASVMPLRGPATAMIAVTDGAIVVPGLHDAHGHFVGLGASLSELDLRDTPDQAAILEQVRKRAASGPDGWIVGRGWDQNDWPDPAWPTRAALDAVAPDTPVFLRRIDGHAAWVNSRALAAAGITRETPDPPGGRILKDGQGEPTGVLIDTAQGLVSRQIPPPDDAALRERIRLADAEARRLGLTMVHDAGAGSREIALYRALSEEGTLATRLYVMIDSSEATTREWFARGPLVDPSHKVTVRAVKLYADGALGSRGALLLEDYADEPGTRGLRVTPPERLAAVTAAAVDAGFQPCTHAIGDAANREVLDLYERLASTRAGMRRLRPRIEHAQILDSRDIPRFGRLGVIASVQPTHCTSDMPWAPARLGAARIDEGAYPWRSLLERGAFLAAGSDFPVERPDPLLGFYAAITRQATDGRPPGGWNPSQRLRRDEALRSFTLDAAFAAHAEADLGSIAEGKLADFVVLSRNIMTIPAAEILQTSVLRTFIGGRQVYEKE